MFGVAEIAIIVVIGGVIFFGKKTVIDWVKTIAQVKQTYSGEIDKVSKKIKKNIQ